MADQHPEPIYDVSVKGYGTGFDLSLEGARAIAASQRGTVMVSRDGGRTWNPLSDSETESPLNNT